MNKQAVRIDSSRYPVVAQFSREMGLTKSVPVQGRDAELKELILNLHRPVISSPMLLAQPGTGKTALVEFYAQYHTQDNEHVLELDVVSMAEHGRDRFNALLKRAMDEIIKLQQEIHQILNVFIDEVHVVVQNGGTDAIKPILARSGQMGIRLIVATTDEEYFDYIKPNLALDQRLQPIKMSEPSDEEMLPILRNTVKFNAPEMNEMFSDALLKKAIEYGRYQPSTYQPRKSILYIDRLIGKYRAFGEKPTMAGLNDVLESATGIRVDWKVDIDRLVTNVKKKVKGQDAALKTMSDSLNISVAGLNDPGKPMGSYLFVGSSGTGKTELSRTLAKELFGSEKAMQRFDMSEYQTDESVVTFQDRVTTALISRPYTILLLDEFEKANTGVRNLMLQLLDDGRMSDRYGRQISGLNAYIIMTSNLGAETLKNIAENDGDVSDYTKLLMSDLQINLSPEFLGRLSAVVPFQPLGNGTLAEIAEIRFKDLDRRIYTKYGIRLVLKKEDYELPDGYSQGTVTVNKVLAYIVANGVERSSNNGGGRLIARRIEQEVAAVVSEYINKHPNPKESILGLQVSVTGKMILDDRYDSEGSARLQVSPIKKKKQNNVKV